METQLANQNPRRASALTAIVIAILFLIPFASAPAQTQQLDYLLVGGNPKTVADKATYEHPEILSVGMEYIFINGTLAVNDGKYTGVLAGKALRHKPVTSDK